MTQKHPLSTRRRRIAVAALSAALCSLLVAANAMAAAVFTTFDTTLDGCLHGSQNNCNDYSSKNKVFISGGPTSAGLANGTYFFAVLTPGSQNGGFLDGATGNLSDTTVGGTTGDLGSGDLVSNRTFTVANHEITTYAGSHFTSNGGAGGRKIIQLVPFDNTDNPGRVYILAVCAVGATSPSDCKFDAFKAPPTAPPGSEQGPPICVLSAQGTDGTGHKFIQITVQDTGSGLASITVLQSKNANVFVPPFTVGTTSAVTVTATVINNKKPAIVGLRVTDVAGNVTLCDPVIRTVYRRRGMPRTTIERGLPMAEHFVRVTNGRPGVERLLITVNGHRYTLNLRSGQRRTLNVVRAMRSGHSNTVKITTAGKRTGSALVVISD